MKDKKDFFFAFLFFVIFFFFLALVTFDYFVSQRRNRMSRNMKDFVFETEVEDQRKLRNIKFASCIGIFILVVFVYNPLSSTCQIKC